MAPIRCAVVRAYLPDAPNGFLDFEGINHGEAFELACETLPDAWDGCNIEDMFRTSDGRTLTRAEAQAEFRPDASRDANPAFGPERATTERLRAAGIMGGA